MRIYAVRRSPARFAGFGQADVPPANVLLPTLLPGATPVTDDRQTIDARDRFIFREKNNLIDVAILGTIAPPVTIGPYPGRSTVLVGYAYGPNAGKAQYVPLEDFFRQGWWAADPKQNAQIRAAGGEYRRPVYPYTIADLDANLELIENYVKDGVRLIEAGNVAGARHALSRARDNIQNAWHRLLALRDSGLPFELTEALGNLIGSVSNKTGELNTKINESDAGAMAKIGRTILSFFGSNVPAVQRAFSEYYVLARKKVIELYQLRKATEVLVRELARLPQTEEGSRFVAQYGAELQKLNRDIAAIEGEAAKYGMKVPELFAFSDGDLSEGLGLGPIMAALAFIGVTGTTAKVIATIIAFVISAIIYELIVPGIISRVTSKKGPADTSEHQEAGLEILKQYLIHLRETAAKTGDVVEIDKVWDKAVKVVVAKARIANLEEFKKLADERQLQILNEILVKEGIDAGIGPKKSTVIGPDGKPVESKEAAAGSDDTALLVAAGVLVLGPILVSLFKRP